MTFFLSVFTLTFILVQTLCSIFVGWLTLECKLQPYHSELQEVTLTKLLYLYDPKACGRIYFYNYTTLMNRNEWVTSVQWPIKNNIAAKFRQKIKINLALHILWLGFAIAYMTQGHRVCGFYVTLLPFSLIGTVICAVDLLNTSLFLADTSLTGSEMDILNYININNDSLRHIKKTTREEPFKTSHTPMSIQDTSWISLLFAYCSCRGVVFWFLNFWMIKDNYFEGLDVFRRLQNSRVKELARIKALDQV